MENLRVHLWSAISAAVILSPPPVSAGSEAERAMLCLAGLGQETKMPESVDREFINGFLALANNRADGISTEIGTVKANLAKIEMPDGAHALEYEFVGKNLSALERQTDGLRVEIDCWTAILGVEPGPKQRTKDIGAAEKGRFLGQARNARNRFASQGDIANTVKSDIVRLKSHLEAAEKLAKQNSSAGTDSDQTQQN